MVKSIKILLIIIFSIIIYFIAFLILRLGLEYLPNIFLWGDLEPIFTLYTIDLTIIDIFYFFFGLVVVIHGFLNLELISKENHKAQNMTTRKPEKLVTSGFYSRARHPMYGTFIIINLGLFISTRSLWGVFVLLIMCIVQYINTIYEEKNELLKIFGDEYRSYMNKVKNRIFIPSYKIYIIISIVSLLGIFYAIGKIYFSVVLVYVLNFKVVATEV